MTRGSFVVFEGPDASGKTTQARRVAELRGAMFTREPGGTPIGERIRDVLLNPDHHEMHARTEALLYAAQRAQNVAEIIVPALEAGRDVVSDRFVASSIAYQGVGRGLGVGDVEALSEFATGGLAPDLVVLLEVPADVTEERLAGSLDRLEQAGLDLQREVLGAYHDLALADPERWVLVDGVGTPDEVGARLDAVLHERLGW